LRSKTQVFVYHEGDHYRTRLTHTLEVAQVTRSLARALNANEDLAEAVALAHDLGHTPFAHIGEEFLKECMKNYDGFDHNDQSLRILTTLERRYPRWNGLNLTWETLEGVVKHNGPVTGALPVTLKELQSTIDLEIHTHASLEAQIAALSDDIAYNNHDVEDGIRANLFTLNDLETVPLLRGIIRNLKTEMPDMELRYLVHEMIREMIGKMVNDVLEQTRANLEEVHPQTPDDIRHCGKQIVAFSEEMREQVDELRSFLFDRMYRHYSINRIWLKVERIVTDLFDAFTKNYRLLPDPWQRRVEEAGGMIDNIALARIVSDYIAGMTDRYAIREHEKLFDLYWDLRIH
jgi:dGTPase